VLGDNKPQSMLLLILFLLMIVVLLPSCASTSSTEAAYCFKSQEEARHVGQKIFNNGFTHRVNYWISGDIDNGLSGLGLLWGGISPEQYCDSGRFPIVITYEAKILKYNEQDVMEWSRLVFGQMLKELNDE